MKNILKTIGLVFGLGLFMQACDDWTMPEANIIQNLDGTPKSEEYYRKDGPPNSFWVVRLLERRHINFCKRFIAQCTRQYGYHIYMGRQI